MRPCPPQSCSRLALRIGLHMSCVITILCRQHMRSPLSQYWHKRGAITSRGKEGSHLVRCSACSRQYRYGKPHAHSEALTVDRWVRATRSDRRAGRGSAQKHSYQRSNLLAVGSRWWRAKSSDSQRPAGKHRQGLVEAAAAAAVSAADPGKPGDQPRMKAAGQPIS